MAKPKSVKLRALITLRTLLKYADSDHRMTSARLNEFLKPYGLDCDMRVWGDTIRVLQEFGFDVRSRGKHYKREIWIDNSPLKQSDLARLIFAVSTNTNLSRQQATEILQVLKPFVTVYQEPLLKSNVEAPQEFDAKKCPYEVYTVIQEAISANRRVLYTESLDQAPLHRKTKAFLFAPKCIYQTNGQFYMIGYNSTYKRKMAVDLNAISSIKLARKRENPHAELARQCLSDCTPEMLISKIEYSDAPEPGVRRVGATIPVGQSQCSGQ